MKLFDNCIGLIYCTASDLSYISKIQVGFCQFSSLNEANNIVGG